MKIRTVSGPDGARAATGDVVIIDVIRAFTTAAYAFDAGIEEIELVSTVDELFARSGFRMGEVGGKLIPGADHNNSPSLLAGRRLSGRAVQRTGAGTQGAVLATRARTLRCASLVVAGATARALGDSDEVALVAMGAPGEPAEEEDWACALYIEALLRGEPPPRDLVVGLVRSSKGASFHSAGDPDRPIEDIDCCVAIDRFDFAMKVDRRDGRLVLRKEERK
jgi:2-phosphosulfolactate phosphatase